ncbi:SDR family NAD(P)-dependent oxidoreductase [Streptomyces ziwulingensis]|uniref:SDR family NAD(P)-dependent oxidoreductase n=1 Tax=Streptomyces ziwulingensis TaxID=1045501 RepID=UPI0031E5EDA5
MADGAGHVAVPQGNGSPAGGRVVLVTGGASGIGAAVAGRLAARGDRVLVADIDARRGEAVAARTGALFLRTNVAELEDNEAAVEAAVAAFGRLDVVHLNAGITGGTSLGPDFDLDGYRKIVGINLDSVVFGIQAALPHVRRSGGRIVVTASAAALRPSIEVVYSATKSAVVALVRSLAPVLQRDGVTLNALCPGLVDTPLIAARRSSISAAGLPVASAEQVADAFETVLADERTGQAWLVMADRPVIPFPFPELPVPGAEKLIAKTIHGADMGAPSDMETP